MAKPTALINAALHWIVPERKLYIRTGEEIRHAPLSPGVQVVSALTLMMGLLGTVYFVSLSVADSVGAPRVEIEIAVIEAAYEQRITALTKERARLVDALNTLQSRHDAALTTLDAQNARLTDLSATARETAAHLVRISAECDHLALDLSVVTLEASQTATERDGLTQQLRQTLAFADDLERSVVQLAGTVLARAEREAALSAEHTALATQMEHIDEEIMLLEQQQARVFDRIEGVVSVGLGTLEGVFKRAGTDVEALLDTMDTGFAGRGGLEVVLPELEEQSYILPGESLSLPSVDTSPSAQLFEDLHRMSLLAEAFENMPLGHPVRSRHRKSSRFGPRRDPFTGRLSQHNGFDFAAPTGTPIYASATGRVIMAGTLGAYGKMIKIRHDFGYDTLYAHLHKIRVDRGDVVERGDLIGDMGSTGRSTGPHLHYEIHKDGRPVDPINYLRAARYVL